MATSWRNRHTLVPAVYMILERDNQIFLIRRANTGFRDGFYALPAGHMDGGEPASVAACREALEEVGVTVNPEDAECVYVNNYVAEEGDHERVGFYFRAKQWKGEPFNKEPHKSDDARWVSYDELPENMVLSMKKAVMAVRAGIFYTEDYPTKK